MDDILHRIVAHKKKEVAALRSGPGLEGHRSDTARSLYEAIRTADGMGIIAEVKKASPSRGTIRTDFDPVAIAEEYGAGGADAVSVLTDEAFFQGHTAYIEAVRAAVTCPVLRKEFIIDPVQVAETARCNADAMLLIAEILDPGQLQELYQAAREYDIEPLVELHSLRHLDKVMALDPAMIGINNRDLHTFVTDIHHTVEIRAHVPAHVACIAESGIFTGVDTAFLRTYGVTGVLVGESLMKSGDPATLLRELRYGSAR
jgi:indole-3-glycerol phosphate synthase